VAKTKKKAKVKSKSKAQSKAKTKAKAKVKSKTKPKAKPKAKAKTKPKTKAKAKVNIKTKTPAKTKVKAKAKSSAKPKASVTPKASSASLEKLISPLADRLVVRVQGPSEKTAGGLFIPGTASERPNQGVVLACGPGGKNKKGHLKPLDVKKGDTILFNAFAGISAEIEGEEVLILREEEVLGILSTAK